MTDDVDIALSVDALSPRLTGIGRYCYELAQGLPGFDGINKVSYFRGSHWIDDVDPLLKDGWQPVRKGRLARNFSNWRRSRRMSRTIVHGPNYFLPDWAEGGVITVHDLSVLLYPETHPIARVQDFERRFQRSLDQAEAIITDSEAVRAEVISNLGIAPARIWTVPLGVQAINTPIHGSALVELGLIAGQYSLCVSTFEPRKRIDRLVEAYGRLDPALRNSVPLVLAGASGWLNEELNQRIAAAQAQGWLKRVDFVPQSLLDTLYAGAKLFVYPSRYEGFGLPPIEAMRHGIATLVGNAASLIEVTKGAARIVDADDVHHFTEMLADSLENGDWQKQAQQAGKRVAEGYTWPKCLSQTVDVYRSLSAKWPN